MNVIDLLIICIMSPVDGHEEVKVGLNVLSEEITWDRRFRSGNP